jgi:hypothetical protein
MHAVATSLGSPANTHHHRAQGGALCIDYGPERPVVSATNCLFSNNKAGTMVRAAPIPCATACCCTYPIRARAVSAAAPAFYGSVGLLVEPASVPGTLSGWLGFPGRHAHSAVLCVLAVPPPVGRIRLMLLHAAGPGRCGVCYRR